MENYENIRRWSDLSAEERELYNMRVAILAKYLEANANVKLTWDQVNNILGLEHLYRWTFDRLAEDFDMMGKTLKFDKENIWIE